MMSGRVLLGALLCVMGAACARADGAGGFVPFDAFQSDLSRAPASRFMLHPDARVAGVANVEEARAHLQRLYRGMSVHHSFMLDGQTFDCVPVREQPALRPTGAAPATPPPIKLPVSAEGLRADAAMAALATTQDEAGNDRQCPAATVPMRRITLRETSRFANLREFFGKGRGAAPPMPPSTPGSADAKPSFNGHSYAYAYTYGTFFGSFSEVSLWRPVVNGKLGQLFSLSQQWLLAGSGRQMQTVEVGWQVYPDKYGNAGNNLFVYWTADGYGSTGCYNLECSAFVQTTKAALLGATFGTSVPAGEQRWVDLGYVLYQGNWWLQGNGNWIGYYPASLFGTGPLASSAQLLEFGGETYGSKSWPPIGVGYWASAGYGRATYHRQMAGRDATGALVRPRILAEQPFPNCYTASAPVATSSAIWGTYFFFGGPGGQSC